MRRAVRRRQVHGSTAGRWNTWCGSRAKRWPTCSASRAYWRQPRPPAWARRADRRRQGRIDEVVRKVGAAYDELAAARPATRQDPRRLETVRKVLIVCCGGDANPRFLGLCLAVWVGIDCLRFQNLIARQVGVSGVDPGCRDVCTVRVVGDTCVAMGEWVQHPQARTALDDILPCVDTAAAKEALNRSKEVNYQLVAVLNAALTTSPTATSRRRSRRRSTTTNRARPCRCLCSHYAADLRDRACAPGEVPLDATTPRQAWQRYVCRGVSADAASGAELTGAADVSYGLYHYGPALVALADCTFVRETFRSIGDDHCPGLSRYSGQVFRGLLAAAVAVLLAVLLWVVHSRERRRRSEAMEILRLASSPYKYPLEERAFLKSPARPYM
ncbi:hypothetical protein Zm00014a_014182 [Zea mays]|uniref:Uncharacterized protein n=1 Tax=Zea mays TaxID=4577 RepID=A0A317YGE8_MAIZE|nr:hypothetical protein Zm00014a_014182 [Zea mays]